MNPNLSNAFINTQGLNNKQEILDFFHVKKRL